jgi:hypothetical protein
MGQVEQVRHQWRLILNGQKIEVESNALDRVKADRPNESDETRGLRSLHLACLRNRAEGIPLKFEEFLNMLDSIEELNDDGADGLSDLDPTHAAD